ncbi:type II toxin-antitoxin system HicB family antitoxin [Hansschlegelia zhihuaiae]|uniref:Uncharacterized protein n=1 Tax=Hansschlegelia zhihuaiae TaxID=405005 RepID=A0A4Q0MJW5_9HYPH|nr:type II toxin-antitoxin system HicB family antitoxin [Hansschlegelia zhihuaiae]RXF73703.1 hypothetical protein EK403_08925 [Hansschlegelia zhihuaiae]
MKCVSTRKVDYVGIVEVSDEKFYVWFPDVPGAFTGVNRVSEIPAKATKSLYMRLKWLEQHNEPLPSARSLTEVLGDPVVTLSMADSVDFTVAISVSIVTETTSVVAPLPDWQMGHGRDRMPN